MFKPVQYINPAGISPGISYREYSPSPLLSQYIASYWTVHSKYPLSNELHRIIPDACIDLVCNLDEKKAFLSGIMDSTTFSITRGSFYFFGIRFLPNTIPHLLGLNSSSNLNTRIELIDVKKSLSTMAEKIFMEKDLSGILRLVEEELRLIFSDFRINNRLNGLLQYSLETKGSITVRELAQVHDLSTKQVGRYFQEYLGI